MLIIKFKLPYFYLTIFLIIFFKSILLGADTIAFGNFYNESDQWQYDYLSKSLPNSIASSIETQFKVNILKPLKIKNILIKKKLNFKNFISEEKLPLLAELIGADYIIYGRYYPLPKKILFGKKQLKITFYLFIAKTKELFSFVETGNMETEIFSLVDRLSIILTLLTKNDLYFKNTNIAKNSNLAFITNFTGSNLHEFYIPFLEKKYKISAIQNNELYTHYHFSRLNKFSQVYTKPTGIRHIRSEYKVKFKFGSWMGKNKINLQKHLSSILKIYYYDFPEIKFNTLKNLARAYNYRIDYLFIIIFNENDDSAMLRCINMRTLQVVWFQTNLKIDGENKSNYINTANNIIQYFNKK